MEGSRSIRAKHATEVLIGMHFHRAQKKKTKTLSKFFSPFRKNNGATVFFFSELISILVLIVSAMPDLSLQAPPHLDAKVRLHSLFFPPRPVISHLFFFNGSLFSFFAKISPNF